MSIVPLNFSTTKACSLQIRKQLDAGLITHARITSFALSILAIFDLTAHTIGAITAFFYASAKSVTHIQKPDYKRSSQHIKCMKIYIERIPKLSVIGMKSPKAIKEYDNHLNQTLNVLFLGRQPKISKDCVVDTLHMIKNLQQFSNDLPQEKREKMASSLSLLNDAKRFLMEQRTAIIQHVLCNNFSFTNILAKMIDELRSCHDNIFETILFKECLSRVFALGLSVTALFDVIYLVFTQTLAISVTLIHDCMTGSKIFHNDKELIFRIYMEHFRDIFITIFGAVFGSFVGFIHPTVGSRLSNPQSEWYKWMRASRESMSRMLKKQIQSLQDQESTLIPIAFSIGSEKDYGHIVYGLITKTKDSFQVSITNKGIGQSIAKNILINETLKRHKNLSKHNLNYWETYLRQQHRYPLNFTVKEVQQEDLEEYIENLLKLMNAPDRILDHYAEEEQTTVEKFMFKSIYNDLAKLGRVNTIPLSSNGFPSYQNKDLTILAKTQAIGDCPRTSLLAALYFHSAYKVSDVRCNPEPYKSFKKDLRNRVFEKYGHLLDHSISLRECDVSVSEYVRNLIAVKS